MLILSTADTSDTIQAILEHVPNIRQSTDGSNFTESVTRYEAPRVTGTRRLRGLQHRPAQRIPILDTEVTVRPQKEAV
jgi:hypothetical protein